ncbi:unnamed protein product [Protopolystoma xenopodis]|uniref:Uncharacterized protein n=1 Tax=Protopolystoma xenopodis TaxID=117903 RepID=A0A448X1F0_9PLAT|nr:unnamed protein product [Protopolystoma xenopodis]
MSLFSHLPPHYGYSVSSFSVFTLGEATFAYTRASLLHLSPSWPTLRLAWCTLPETRSTSHVTVLQPATSTAPSPYRLIATNPVNLPPAPVRSLCLSSFARSLARWLDHSLAHSFLRRLTQLHTHTHTPTSTLSISASRHLCPLGPDSN